MSVENDEEIAEKDIITPIFNPKTFFDKNMELSLKDYELDAKEAKRYGLFVSELRDRFKEKADKIAQLLKNEEEKQSVVSEQIKYHFSRSTSQRKLYPSTEEEMIIE